MSRSEPATYTIPWLSCQESFQFAEGKVIEAKGHQVQMLYASREHLRKAGPVLVRHMRKTHMVEVEAISSEQ